MPKLTMITSKSAERRKSLLQKKITHIEAKAERNYLDDYYLQKYKKELDYYGKILDIYKDSTKTDKKKAGTLYCTKDELDAINQGVQDTVRDIAAQMYGGVIEKRPDGNACRYCRIKDSCEKAVLNDF